MYAETSPDKNLCNKIVPTIKEYPSLPSILPKTHVKSTKVHVLKRYVLTNTGDTRYNWSKSAKVREHPIISCFSRRGKQKSLALGFSPISAPSKSDSGFLQKQRAARELDSGQLPSGRMRNPNRTHKFLKMALGPKTTSPINDTRVQNPQVP
ncbi:BnaC01g23870D [Brassica napus]|uniref:BnaC01g23870D protein n=2 Tax=Brassica TaxID=3705 RepID=A0A078G6T9_BRANA|nr:BnaC01g23870D [Brassica napus]